MSNLTGHEITTLVFVGLMFGGPLIGGVAYVVATNWRRVRVAEQEALLKKEMLDRGFTAEQIVAVLSCGGEPSAAAEPDLLGALVGGGYSGEDVARVSAALDRVPAAARGQATRLAVKMAENGYSGDDLVRYLETRAEPSGAALPRD